MAPNYFFNNGSGLFDEKNNEADTPMGIKQMQESDASNLKKEGATSYTTSSPTPNGGDAVIMDMDF